MITESYFEELVKDLFNEYLPKVKAAERKELTSALIDELKAHDYEFEEDSERSEADDLFGGISSEDY